MSKTPVFTAHLASLVCDLAVAPLPGDVVQKAKLCLVDYLAASLAGAGSHVAAAGRVALPAFGDGQAMVLARPERTSLLGSVFYHALVATVEDLDDSHRYASGLHLSAITFPVALALAESSGASGALFLKAVAAGYEISSRICRAADTGLRERGFHATGAVGPFGACAAACVLMGLDENRTARALGAAASGAGGLFAFLPEGAPVRHAHAAWASVNGLLAARLAAHGLDGPRLALEGKDGFFQACATRYDPDFVLAPPPGSSGQYEILNAYHKVFSSCGHAIPALTAALDLRDALLPRLDQIERIDVRAYKASAALDNPAPASASETKFSLPVLIPLALVHGAVTQRELTPEFRDDPAIRRLAERVQVKEDPEIATAYPRVRSAELIITLTDGTIHRRHVDAPTGMPENPVDLRALETKFRTAANGLLSSKAQEEVLVCIQEVETRENLLGLLEELSAREIA